MPPSSASALEPAREAAVRGGASHRKQAPKPLPSQVERPGSFGLTLALRLYFLLVLICLSGFLLYYNYSVSSIESMHDAQVETVVRMCRTRIESWFASHPRPARTKEAKEELVRQLRNFVEEPNGVESVVVFGLGQGRSLTFLAGAGDTTAQSPTAEDRKANDESEVYRLSLFAGQERRIAISMPLYLQSAPTGVLHMELAPERVSPSIGSVQKSMIFGAVLLMLAMGVGVVAFFHFVVRKPMIGLLQAMESAQEGDLTAVVRIHSGEFGHLARSYNHMMLRLKLSVDENRRLIEQAKTFNENLKKRIDSATKELATKNKQLETANEKLFSSQRHSTRLEKLASLGQLATILAHELGTPLNAISGHLQLLLQENIPDDAVSERLQVIDAQVDRLTGIVRDVLETMRMPPTRFTQVHVEDLIKNVASLIVPIAQKSEITLDLRLPEKLPPIHGDAGQLEQLFMNLFTNAMDAMKGGGLLAVSARFLPEGIPAPEGDGAARVERGPSCLLVEVTDNGEGMSELTLQRAFEPFFTTKRLNGESRATSGSGIGLGLAICQQIVRNHHGKIAVTSARGKGTSFRITFPLQASKQVLTK